MNVRGLSTEEILQRKDELEALQTLYERFEKERVGKEEEASDTKSHLPQSISSTLELNEEENLP
jgi:hypothetical protein